jgi:hypothetical protein
MRVLLFDINPEETSQYIYTTFKYRNIASNIGPIMMLPAPEFAFADQSPSIKGRRCACVTVNCWSDTEMAYELVSELRRNGETTIPHIGGIWSVKLLNDNAVDLLATMAGNVQWVLREKIDNSVEDFIDDIDDYIYDSDSEVARIFPETTFENYPVELENYWRTMSSDGDIINTNYEDEYPSKSPPRYLKIPSNWLCNNSPIPSPTPMKPKLVRWPNTCTKTNCDLCLPLEEEPTQDMMNQSFTFNFDQ